MARMAAERIDWIVVFDGAKALLFENEGFSDAPDFKLLEKDEIDTTRASSGMASAAVSPPAAAAGSELSPPPADSSEA